jgi:hypothetical protein
VTAGSTERMQRPRKVRAHVNSRKLKASSLKAICCYAEELKTSFQDRLSISSP